MKIEVYGPIKKYRLYMMILIVCCAGALLSNYVVIGHFREQVIAVERDRLALEQRSFSLVSSNERLEKKVLELEKARPKSLVQGKPVEDTSALAQFSEEGFLLKGTLRERQEETVSKMLILAVKKITGRRCQLGLTILPGHDQTLIWLEEGGEYNFQIQKVALTLKLTEINPYDRAVQYSMFRSKE